MPKNKQRNHFSAIFVFVIIKQIRFKKLFNYTMAGIYIHIPYCRQACSYCNFHFSTLLYNMPDMVEALQKEIILRKDFFKNKRLNSIYFGGGTPSLLPLEDIDRLIKDLYKHFTFIDKPEITVEVNPDDCSFEYLRELGSLGINRLSIGIQSFHQQDLEYLGRIHNAEQAHRIIQNAQKAGFYNMTVDLMYGLPSSSKGGWQANLDTLLAYNIPHFSAYALTIEPRTLLNHQIEQGKVTPPQEEQYNDDYNTLKAFSDNHHFDHYEISNFAKDSFHAIHNSSYWFGEPYLGLGPGAHSFDGASRQWNISNNPGYLKSLQNDELAFEQEDLSKADQFNELIMTGLRTKWGIEFKRIREEFGEEIQAHFEKQIKEWEKHGTLQYANGHVYLRPGQTLIADHVIADCFYIDEKNGSHEQGSSAIS